MSGNKAKINSKAEFEIVRAKRKDVGLLVRFNGQQLPVMLAEGETRTLNFGNFPVEIEVVEVVKPEPKVSTPAGPRTRRFRFVGPTGVDQSLLARDEADAWDRFTKRNGKLENITISELSS